MTNCIIEQSGQTIKKYFSLTSYDLIEKDERIFDIYKKTVGIADRINAEKHRYIDLRDSFEKHRKTLDDKDKNFFVDNLRSIIADAKKSNMKSISLHELMNAKKVFSNEEIMSVEFLDRMLGTELDTLKIFSFVNADKGLLDIYDNLPNSMKYPILSMPGMRFDNVKKVLGGIMEQNGITGKRQENMINDFIGGPLGVGALRKISGTLRQFYSMLKFGPVTGLVGGSMLLMNNMVLGVLNLMGRRRGLESLLNHKALDRLIEGADNYEGILKNSGREMSLSRENLSINGKNIFFEFTKKLLDKIPFLGDVGKQRLESVILSGIHTIRDMGAENTVRRTAIVQALSKNGIGEGNIDLFYKRLEEGNITQDFINKLRADAHLFNTKYYTSGNIVALNRHTFSRRWMFTNLQNYVIVRSDEMFRGIKNCYDVRKSGDLRTRGQFLDYINTENQELKSFLNNILLAAKTSIYINHIVNQHEQEDNKSTFKYMAGMSEYVSSLNSTFFMRILQSPFSGMSKYMRYSNVTGQEESFTEGISVAFMNTLAETMAMLFREGKTLDIFIDTASAIMKTGDVDFALSVASTDLDKLSNGMGRFMLIPGEDTYGQRAIEQSDDFISRIAMSYGYMNEATKKSGRIRGIGDAEQILTDTKGYMIRAFQYLPIRGKVMEMGKDKVGWNEAKYKALTDMIENDPSMRQIRDGVIPEGLLASNPEIVKSLYQDLTAFQYYNKKYEGGGKHKVSEYGLASMEEDVFVQNILKTYNLDAELLGQSANKKELIKVLAAAEASEPGSSRIVLSYLANNELKSLKNKYLGDEYAKGADIPEDIEGELHRMIVEKYYPYMYTADKTSRYNLATKYVEYAQPEIFEGLSKDTKLQGFVNSLGFLDLMVKEKGDAGDVNAAYIKNAFNFGTKYITDPGDKLKIIKHTMATIDGLNNPDISQKQLMRLGVIGANVSFYNELKKDKVASILYKKDMEEFEGMIWDSIDDINLKGIKGIEGDMSGDDGAKKQYYGAYGKPYTPATNSSANKQYVNDLMDKYNKVLNPMEYGRPSYIRGNPISYPRSSEIGNLTPKRYKIYAKFYEEELKAFTKGITSGSVKQYPSQYIESLKFSMPNYNKGGIPKPGPIKFKRPAKKYVSYKTLGQFPGSTDDNGAG